MTAPLTEKFHAALDDYNRGDYLAAQEALEQVVGSAEESEQPLVRATLMLSCAMYLHFKRGGGRGVLNLLRQALILLDDFRPRHLGVEVADLYDSVEAYLQELRQRRKPGATFLDRWLAPRIRYEA